MKTALLLACALLLPPCVAAQTTASQTSSNTPGDFENLPVPEWGHTILDSFSRPLHPVIGGIASGGGLGFGIGYNSPDDGRWYREGEAMVTVRRYWSLAGEIGRRTLDNRGQLGLFGDVRHMNRIHYFGIGPDTVYDDRSTFRLRETAFGTRGWYRPAPAVRVGGSASIYLPDLGPGSNRNVPSIEERFSPATIPGFSAEPTFGRYRAFVELTNPFVDATESEELEAYRGVYQLAVESVRDHDTGQHDFHRWELETQQRIPGLREGQRLTLHGFLATTNTNADVPFYMLYTLGGSGGLKAFRPDLLGTDGTRATLRGFRNYRFRDRNLLLMQAEYRIPLHRRVHSTVFIDSGKVAGRPSQLFDDLRTTTGFSLSYVRKGRSVGRMDVGFGGGEGVQVFWSFGAFQN